MFVLIFSYVCVVLGALIMLIGASNIKKSVHKGEKTTTGTVVEFGLLEEGHLYPLRYKAIIKAGQKKYEIESYSMPWLKEDEEVKIQITGKQRVLGTKRLNTRGKTEILFGIMLWIFAILVLFVL